MERDQVAALLARGPGHVSGEEMSRTLGVTRAAVWKEIETLRAAGWPIESSTRKGYKLAGPPPMLSAPYISARLAPDNLFAGKVMVESLVDSTNTRLKAMAAAGAPTGTALLAEEQSGGRGTHGRSFQSPKGDGLYLSVLLRPRLTKLQDLLTLTGWVGVAAREAVERASGAPAEIKWLNDLYLNGKKLCGILTELSFLGESGEPDYVVAGLGVGLSGAGGVSRGAEPPGRLSAGGAGRAEPWFPRPPGGLSGALSCPLRHPGAAGQLRRGGDAPDRDRGRGGRQFRPAGGRGRRKEAHCILRDGENDMKGAPRGARGSFLRFYW